MCEEREEWTEVMVYSGGYIDILYLVPSCFSFTRVIRKASSITIMTAGFVTRRVP